MPPLLNPRTGLPLETYPDEVRPEDLQVAPSPLEGMDPASPAAQMIAGEVEQARATPQPVTPEGQLPPAPLTPAAPAPKPAALVPAPKPSSARPAGPPKPDAEGKARAAEKEAGEGAMAIAGEERELAQRKAIAEGKQTEADQAAIKAHYDDVDKRTAAGMDYLQKQQDKVANFKVKDMYEGQTGAAIAAALMEGLGAFGAALTGGPNHAANVIERGRAVFRQKQLDELEGLNKGVVNAKDRIELTRAELASREAGMFKRLAADRAANMARFGYDQARIEGDKVYQDLLGKQAEAERTWQSMLHTRGQTEKLQASQIAQNYAAAAKDRADAAAGRGKAVDPSLLDVAGPGGKVIFSARNPDEAKAAKEEVANTRDLLAKARELKALIDEGPTFFGVGDRAAKMDQLQADLMNQVRVAQKMGTLDKGSVEQLEKMIPSRAGALGTGKVKMDQFIKTAREAAARRFDVYGVPGQKVVDHLERTDSAAAATGPAPTQVEYARTAEAYRKAAPGSPEQRRLRQTLDGMRGAMGH